MTCPFGFGAEDAVAVREVMEGLSTLRRKICWLLSRGRTQVEAARELEMSPQLLNYHVQCVRRAFVEAGFEEATVRQKQRKHRRVRTGWGPEREEE